MAVYRTDAGLSWADLGEPCLDFANYNVQKAAQYLGPLAVDFAEVPSATLNVKVAAGGFRASDGQRVGYAGANPVAVPASATTRLWLDDAGTLQQGTAFPTDEPIVRLAEVVAGVGSVAAITDRREPLASFGAGAGAYLELAGGTMAGDVTMDAGADLVLATAGAGTMIGTGANELLGFHGATPSAQPAGASQAALTDSTGGSTADFVLADAANAAALTDSTGGSAGGTLAAMTIPASLSGDAGGSADGAIQTIGAAYVQAEVANNFDELRIRVNQLAVLSGQQRDALASLAAAFNALRDDVGAANDNVAKLARLLDASRAALVAKGLMKGGA